MTVAKHLSQLRNIGAGGEDGSDTAHNLGIHRFIAHFDRVPVDIEALAF